MNIIGGKLGNRVSNRIRRGRDAGICGGQAPGNEKRMEGASQSRQPNDASRRTLGVRGQDRSDALLLPGKAWAGGHRQYCEARSDALCKHIYMDDAQVERVLVQKFEPGNVFPFRSPSSALETALSRTKPVLYVRLSNDPFEDVTPKVG